MKVADAMTAIASTLRPRRLEALRRPSRATGHQARPSSGRLAGRRNTNTMRHRHDTSSAVPAPKNAAVRSSPPASVVTVSDAARRANAIAPIKGEPKEARPPDAERLSPASLPASRLRSESRARPASVDQMHTVAASAPPAAPAANETADT